NYATDNRVTLDALAQLGAYARGVAVVHPTVTDAELKGLNDGGIRGIRFSLGGANAVVTWDMVEPLAKRIADLGLPTQMVFDRMGHTTLPAGPDHPSVAIMRGLIDRGRTWVKLSGAYDNTKI